jgi:hypothetical protein
VQLKPIKLPNPLLHLVCDAVKLQSKLGIGGPRSQLATTLYITLNPDQKIERVRLFHLTETSREKPRPMGIKGRGPIRNSAPSHQTPWGNRINGLASRKLKLSQWE